jgi:Zn finger protein HypA/HybF involved in hydrogenase expression
MSKKMNDWMRSELERIDREIECLDEEVSNAKFKIELWSRCWDCDEHFICDRDTWECPSCGSERIDLSGEC